MHGLSCPRGMWNLPGPGLEPGFPAAAGHSQPLDHQRSPPYILDCDSWYRRAELCLSCLFPTTNLRSMPCSYQVLGLRVPCIVCRISLVGGCHSHVAGALRPLGGEWCRGGREGERGREIAREGEIHLF